MGIANQSFQRIAIEKQSGKGTIAPTGDGVIYNYTSDTSGSLTKDTFESNTIRTTQQKLNPRHGTRSVPFELAQELQIGGHTAILEGGFRAAWAAGGTTGAVTTIGINATTKAITRSSGSFVTDGFKVGDIVRASGFVATANNGQNMRLTAVSALSMTYAADSWTSSFVTESAGATVTVSVPGKKLTMATASHTSDYYTIEDWQSDVPSSRRYTDMRVGGYSINIPPNGHATITTKFLGIDGDTQTTVYFSSPDAAATGALLAGPQGLLRYNGTDSAVISDVTIELDNQAEVKAVVGTDLSPDVFVGAMAVTGSLSALFDSNDFLTNFEDEATAALYLYLFENESGDSDFVIIKLPNVKINKADTANDGTARTVSGDFTAGEMQDGSTVVEQTSMVICDSSVV
jgi:hypothetical protein